MKVATQETATPNFSATYSPEDNKLRLYTDQKLSPELYERAKKLCFKYAPKQGLFVAPMWTPCRRNFLLELCGEIQDEQISVEERARQRAERFNGYQEKRKADAENAYNESQKLAEAVPMGQPILVGHHSQRKAEKQAERIDNTMKRAVTMWDRSEYWEDRAKGVLSNVSYKERTDVRLRRIKKLEADKRRQEKNIKEHQKFISLWENPEKELTLKRAVAIANYDRLGNYSALTDNKMTPEEARTIAVKSHRRKIQHLNEWVNHNQLRINYEKNILKAQDYEPPKPIKRTLPPIVNYAGENFIHLTKEQFKKIRADGRQCKNISETDKHGAYRLRRVSRFDLRNLKIISEPANYWEMDSIFITDQKIVEPPKKEAGQC